MELYRLMSSSLRPHLSRDYGHQLHSPKMIGKWSSKPAEHKIIRQRNNQRRHRQKVKDRVTELESQLRETRLQLDQALADVARLSEELEQARTGRNTTLTGSHEANGNDSTTTAHVDDRSLQAGHGCQSVLTPESCCAFDRSDDTIPQERDEMMIEDPVSSTNVVPADDTNSATSPVLSVPWSSENTITTLVFDYQTFVNSGDQDCCDLSPPSPGKSTTRCRDAYFTITQQNYKGLDSSVIRQWLEPGFRRAISQGDGCRVDTDLLFSLLDFISSPSM